MAVVVAVVVYFVSVAEGMWFDGENLALCFVTLLQDAVQLLDTQRYPFTYDGSNVDGSAEDKRKTGQPLLPPTPKLPLQAIRAQLWHYDFSRLNSSWGRRVPGVGHMVGTVYNVGRCTASSGHVLYTRVHGYVKGAWCMVHGAWCMVHGSEI